MIAARALMNLTAQAAYLELYLGLGRPISAVRVNIRRRIGLVQKPIEFLAVMHARVGHVVLSDQLVHGIGIHVVLVSIETLAVLPGPARHPCLSAGFSTGLSSKPQASCRPSRHHFRPDYYAVWEPARSWHQPSGRRERCSPSLPNAGQNARTVSRSDPPSQASPGIAKASCRPECCPRCRAAETA